MSNPSASAPLRWIIAVIAFPIGGYLGWLVGGPASTIGAAAISGAIAGAIIGAGQGLALNLRRRAVIDWAAATAVGLALSLAIVTGIIGQIVTTTEAAALGAVAGFGIGIGQAVLLRRQGVWSAWAWVPASALAWAAGWLTTASVGVALATGWPVYGLSGAVVSQLITGIVVWRQVASRPAEMATPA